MAHNDVIEQTVQISLADAYQPLHISGKNVVIVMSDHPAGNFKQVSQFSRALLNFLVFSCWLKFLASVFSF